MDDKVTTEWLKMCHEEWRKDQTAHEHTLKIWGRWFESVDGPARFRQWVDSTRTALETAP